MATRRIREFLDGNYARYVMVRHAPAYDAQRVAEQAHVPGRQVAKVVVVVVDGRLGMAVVPATHDVDLEVLRAQVGAADVHLADEDQFADRFDGCQLGAAPPFGNLFGVDTYVDASLADEPFIAFPAGTHTDVIVMEFNDYRRLVRPYVARFDVPAGQFRAYAAHV